MEIDNQVNVIYSKEYNGDSIPVPMSAPKPVYIPTRQVPGHACEKCGNFGGELHDGSIYKCHMCKYVYELKPVHRSLPKPGGQLHGHPGLQMNHYGNKCEKCNCTGGNLYYNGNKWIYTCGTCG